MTDGADDGDSAARAAGAVIAAIVAITLAAQVRVPMYPVPMTLQTAAVLVAAALLGAGRATVAVLLYAALGIAGAPVFAAWTAAPGAAFVEMKSAGYILGFVAAAAAFGAVADIRRQRHLPALFAAAVAAHVVVVLCGVAWLARFLPLDEAIDRGAVPFVAGILVKSTLVAGLVHAAARRCAAA